MAAKKKLPERYWSRITVRPGTGENTDWAVGWGGRRIVGGTVPPTAVGLAEARRLVALMRDQFE